MVGHWKVVVAGLDLTNKPWDFRNADGWLDTPGITIDSVDRYRHGTFSMPGRWRGRTLELSGFVRSRDCFEQQDLRDELAGLFPEGESREVRITHGGRELSGSFQLGDQVKFTPITDVLSSWSLLLYSEDPFLIGDKRTQFAYPVGSGVGLVYPWFAGYFPPTEIPVDHWIETGLDFVDLSDAFGTGTIGAGGSAQLSISTDWFSEGGTSLKVGPGTGRTSSAYVVPRNTPIRDWAGRLVTVSATVHVPQEMPDEDTSSGANPPRGILVSMDYVDGSTPFWEYATSGSAPNTPGVYDMTTTFLMPDDPDVYSGWFLRLFNGSATVPVYWDNLRISGQELPVAGVSESVTLQADPLRVTQSFDIDPVSGHYYAGQPKSTVEYANRVNLMSNPSYETGSLSQGPDYPDLVALASNNADISLDTAWAAQGGTSIKVSPKPDTSNNDTTVHPVGGSTLTAMSTMPFQAGDTITIGATIHLEAAQTGSLADHARRIRVNRNNGSSTEYSWALSPQAPNVPGTYRLKATFTLPGDTEGLNFSLCNGSTSGPVWWDAITFEKGDTDGSYFEGTIESNSNGMTGGAAGALVVRRNLIPSPIGAQSKSVGTWSAGSGATVATSTQDGAPCVALTRSGDGFYWGLSSRVDLVPGQVYTLSADIKVTEDVTDARVRLADYHGASLTVIEGGDSQVQAPADGWVRHHVRVRIDQIPDGGYFRPAVETETAPATGEGIYFRRVMLTDAHTTVFMDGETGNTRWAVDQENSVSEQLNTYESTDGYIRRLDENGLELDRMLVLGIGHMNHLSVEHDDDGQVWIWVRWEDGPDLASRVPYRPGVTQVGDLDVTGFNEAGASAMYLSILGDQIGMLAVESDGTYRYSLGELAAFKSDGKMASPTRERRLHYPNIRHTHQGFAVTEDYIYEHRGGSKGDAIGMWRWSWDGAGFDPRILSTAGYGRDLTTSRNEAEGVAILRQEGVDDQILFGISGGPTYERVASVHYFAPVSFNYLEAWENPEIPEETTPSGILTYGEDLADPQATVSNRGNSTAYLQAIVVGDFPGGVTISNGLGTGSLTYPWEISREAPLQLDGRGSAFIGDTNVARLLSAREFRILQVPAGQTGSIFLDGMQGGTGYLQVEVGDTYV